MNFTRLLFAFLVIAIAGCKTVASTEPAGQDVKRTAIAFYGTDRAQDRIDDPSHYYNGQRGRTELGSLRLDLAEDADGQVVSEVSPLQTDEFVTAIRGSLAGSVSRSLVVFVHGYNRSFDEAATEITGFSLRSGLLGVPVVWSWPSLRNPASYIEDRNNMEWSRPNLATFLELLIRDSGAQSIHLIAHSMGCQVLVDSILYELLPRGLDTSRFGELVLLAPDIDRNTFQRIIAPRLVDAGFRVTLYTAGDDKAMTSSRAINGYPRAGDSSDGPVIVRGVETIDASEANRSFLGHSYLGKSPNVEADLAELLNHNRRASRRTALRRIELPKGEYWKIPLD